jgi:hypothetical protein
MRHDHHRLALDLGVTMRDRKRVLFMTARQQFGRLVPDLVDHRFMQRAESRARIRGAVLDAQLAAFGSGVVALVCAA